MKAADLRKVVGAMTPGPYDTYERDFEGPDGALVITSPTGDVVVMPDVDMADANATGIVVLRNHTDALVTLADAVSAWRDAECATESWETDDHVIAARTDECAGDTHTIKCPVMVAMLVMIAALDVLEALP